MANTFFRFKQFTVHQDRCAMKVGTDGVLLGAWVPCVNAGRVLDIGTGTGLIALMLAQRSEALIDAVEIDADAAEQAKENVQNSPWADRIKIYSDSFQNYVAASFQKYDLIVSNPPFFVDSLKSPKERRSNARHTDSLTFQDIVLGSRSLLQDEGTLAVILPIVESESFVACALENGFFLHSQIVVLPKPDTAAKRYLMTFGMREKETEYGDIVVEIARHHYSESFKCLTKDFYL